MSESPVKRQGTMEATAEEGIQYLKDVKKDTLLKAQGLVTEQNGSAAEQNGTAKTASPEKQTTMEATAKEGEAVLESLGGAPDEDAKTRGQQAELDTTKAENGQAENGKEESPSSITKTKTMQDTTEEAKELLKGAEVGETRSETKTIQEATTTTSPTRPKRTTTIDQTVKDSEAVLADSAGDGAPSPKKTKTMEDVVKEGKEFVDAQNKE